MKLIRFIPLALLLGMLIGCTHPIPVSSPGVRSDPTPIVYQCTDVHPASSPIVVPATAVAQRSDPVDANLTVAVLPPVLAEPPPTLPRVHATLASLAIAPPRVVYLADQLDPETARILAEVMDEGVIAKEATTLVIRDADDRLLTQVSHPRVDGSPGAGKPSKLYLHNAYQANSNGSLFLDVSGFPVPAAGAVVIGHVEVANACEAQNKRPIVALIQRLQSSLN